jgi:hypothetical protein
MDPRIQIRIHTKTSCIRNTGCKVREEINISVSIYLSILAVDEDSGVLLAHDGKLDPDVA